MFGLIMTCVLILVKYMILLWSCEADTDLGAYVKDVMRK